MQTLRILPINTNFYRRSNLFPRRVPSKARNSPRQRFTKCLSIKYVENTPARSISFSRLHSFPAPSFNFTRKTFGASYISETLGKTNENRDRNENSSAKKYCIIRFPDSFSLSPRKFCYPVLIRFFVLTLKTSDQRYFFFFFFFFFFFLLCLGKFPN